MALDGLFPGKYNRQSMKERFDLQHPKLGVMLDYILEQQPKLSDSAEMRDLQLLFPSQTYVVMIKFLLKCFESELEQRKSIEMSSTLWSSVEKMCLLLENAMGFEGSVELHATASRALISIGSCVPEVTITMFDAFSIFLCFAPYLLILKFFTDDSVTLCTKSVMAKAISESCGFGYT